MGDGAAAGGDGLDVEGGQAQRLAVDIALSYSDKPLRVMVLCGLAFSFLSLAFVGYSLLRYLQGDVQVAGFTSIIASIWLVGGIVVSSVGVAGLYIGRIFIETKRRPWFVVADRTPPASRAARP